jgi:prevent-host-death family protein
LNLEIRSMNKIISAKELRAMLPRLVECVRKGARYTVVYRSRPAFQIVPVDEAPDPGPLEDDPWYQAAAVGRSTDGLSSADHDSLLYGR